MISKYVKLWLFIEKQIPVYFSNELNDYDNQLKLLKELMLPVFSIWLSDDMKLWVEFILNICLKIELAINFHENMEFYLYIFAQYISFIVLNHV